MKFNSLQARNNHFLWVGAIVLVLMVLIADNAYGFLPKPERPRLSLTGGEGYDRTFYPEGRIRLPNSINSPREFLLPVFIENKWRTSDDPAYVKYKADPIYSFEFDILYDGTVLQALGIEKFKNDSLSEQEPLAKDFNVTIDDRQDLSFVAPDTTYGCIIAKPIAPGTLTSYYRIYLDSCTSGRDVGKGRAIHIVGSSAKPMPFSEDFKILLYVRFQIKLTSNQTATVPIIIDDRKINYNDYNVRTENPFERLRVVNYPNDPIDIDYPIRAMHPTFWPPAQQNLNLADQTGLAGICNWENNGQTGGVWLNGGIEKTLPGSIWLFITDVLPKFDFTINRGGNLNPIQITNRGDTLWSLSDPITVDSIGANGYHYGTRLFRVRNAVQSSRLHDVIIETDQPWLEIARYDKYNPSNKSTPFVRSSADWSGGYLSQQLKFIDAFTNLTDPNDQLVQIATQWENDQPIMIRCNPDSLPKDKGEITGRYIGYITFKSHNAIFSPVRIKVVFYYFRNPFEPQLEASRRGIELTIKNRATSPDSVYSAKIIFGTGFRARTGVDSLFGEFLQTDPLTGFGARWYLDSVLHPSYIDNTPDFSTLCSVGFGDLLPNDEHPQGMSRDIRSIDDTMQTLIYYCRFSRHLNGGSDIVIEWDTLDFPPGSQFYLSDWINGKKFNINMRDATPIPNTQTKFSYTITDPNMDHFVIEYTISRVIKYVDEYGKPIIKKGWNLLSLPVRPTSPIWNNVYPHAINIPFFFTPNQYQQESVLRAGIGYYIKYGDLLDTTFSGGIITKISKTIGDLVLLYSGDNPDKGGWNTIGALTYPTSITDIQFENYIPNEIPDLSFSLAKGIWGYTSNRGFTEVSELKPGLGYWIKVNKNGYLKLAYKLARNADNPFADMKSDIMNSSVRVTLRDNAQNEGTAYINTNKNLDLSNFELPPSPLPEIFDVRFESGRMVENAETPVLTFQGVDHPVSVSMSPDAEYTLIDAATDKVLGTFAKGMNSSVVITNPRINAVKMLRTITDNNGVDFTCNPNPIENIATVNYSIPENSNVTIKLFDLVGNEVVSVVDDSRTIGSHSETLNVSGLNAGSYILRIIAGSFTATQKVTVVK